MTRAPRRISLYFDMVAEAPEPGTIIAGKYRVATVLGSGGMSCLVKADHLLMKKQVAIKFLRSDKEGASRRLVREARAAQALTSEHVVRVFDLGVHEEAPFIVMELLEGVDLAVRVAKSGPLAIEDAVDAVLEASVAVAEAHTLEIFHRDLKPANLFASRTKTHEIIKVLDFGISKLPAAEVEDCEKTSSDAMLGTPYYMSPEQLRNPSNVDGRTDIWALAVTLFFLLTGEHPFPGENRRAVMAAVLTDPPRDLPDDVPLALREAIANAMEKRVDDRTPTIRAFASALLPFASRRGKRAAERILAVNSTPPKAFEDGDQARSSPRDKMATTDDGLSSTLPPTEADTAPAPPPPQRKRRSLVVPALVLLVALTSGALLWQKNNVPAPPVVATPTSTPPPASESSPAVSVATATPAIEPPPEEETRPAPPKARTPASVPKPRAKPLVAVASASVVPVKASSAPPRVDIDGVPIVE